MTPAFLFVDKVLSCPPLQKEGVLLLTATVSPFNKEGQKGDFTDMSKSAAILYKAGFDPRLSVLYFKLIHQHFQFICLNLEA